MPQNSEVDVNILVNLYNSKLASALNQNILLEAKIQTLKNDFEKERNELLEELANLKDEKWNHAIEDNLSTMVCVS